MFSVRMLESLNNDFCQKEERVTKYCDSNCNQALVSLPHHILHLHLYSVIRCSSICKPMSDNSAENCEYDKWSPYSECSVTCGQGKKFSQRFLKKYSVRFQIHSKFQVKAYWLLQQQFETDSEHFANHSKFEKLIVSNLNANQAMKIFAFIIIGPHG